MGNATSSSSAMSLPKSLVIYKGGTAANFLAGLEKQAQSTAIPTAYRLCRKKIFLDKAAAAYARRPFGLTAMPSPLPVSDPTPILVLRDNVIPDYILARSEQVGIRDAMIVVGEGKLSLVFSNNPINTTNVGGSLKTKPLTRDQALAIIQTNISLCENASHRSRV